jgi:thiamine kinase-like enzyme
MNQEDILSGAAGLMAIQQVLNGPSSRRRLRSEVQRMLRPGYRAGRLHLTRAKFKPGRKLSAHYTFPAIDPEGRASDWVQLAVTWQKNMDGDQHADSWKQLQEEANQAGLMPVQCELWRELPERDMKLQIWPFDPEFPHLVRLGDPSYMGQIFASLGITGNPKQIPAVTPIRYRPGERHVLRYDLDSQEPRRQHLYAKLYTNAQGAVNAFGIANRVVDWLAANDLGLQGNRPLAMSQENSVIFYPHASGIPLSHQFQRSRRWLATQLQLIGRSLAILHQGPESLQADLRQNTFTKEVKVVKRASEHIQILLPQAHAKLLQIVDQAEEQYSALPQEKPTFTHSDFKSDHLITTAEGLTLIDFDTCTLTDPAMDIGKFLADLEWWFTLRRVSGVEEAQAELLKGYLDKAEKDGGIHERLARTSLFHVLILVKIVVRRVPLYKKEWATMTGRMLERAAEVLREVVKV